MKKICKSFILTLFSVFVLAQVAAAQIVPADIPAEVAAPDSCAVAVCDSLLAAHADDFDVFSQPLELPEVFFMPAVYDRYNYFTPLTVGESAREVKDWERWLDDYDQLKRRMLMMRQELFFKHPELVQYNVATLPEAPEMPYVTVLNPADFSVSIREDDFVPKATDVIPVEAVKKRHWIRNFAAALQFSQAYVSPNWYQGGNNNLNALASIIYNVKLNEAYHPNLLFETNAQYKLGMNSAPDDSLHTYNISEDVLQINSTFGIKAAKHWYYSLTGQFKTQVLKSYTVNTDNLASAFLSPGELTAGLGMTYTYENPKKTFSINTSIAPVSYHLVTCINDHIDPTQYGIDEGKKVKNQFGSTLEVTLNWKIVHNIALKSHLFAFSDYHSVQADWENTLSFAINSFLTTQIYAHLRYDSLTPPSADRHWKKLQLKEIFSIGFSYKFSSI